MSEFIVDYELIPLKWRDGYGLSDIDLTDEIVRCRDCVHAEPEGEPPRKGCEGLLWCDYLTEGGGRMSEYKPTEYVVDFGDYRSNQFVRLNMALIEQNGAKLGERIVRCRDCVYYDVTGEEHRLYSDKVYCEKLWKYVEPNGFCAWGAREVDA